MDKNLERENRNKLRKENEQRETNGEVTVLYRQIERDRWNKTDGNK